MKTLPVNIATAVGAPPAITGFSIGEYHHKQERQKQANNNKHVLAICAHVPFVNERAQPRAPASSE